MNKIFEETLLSVVIPVLDEEERIGSLLERIRLNTLKYNQYEVIVSDSGSIDKTRDVVENYAKKYPKMRLRFVKASHGVSVARNCGADKSHGKYILFLDADAGIDQHFLENGVEEMEKKNLDAAGCHYVPDSKKIIDKFCFNILANMFAIRLMQFTKKPLTIGSGIMARRSVHDQIGGFDNEWSFAEDSDYLSKASKIGYKVRILSSVKTVFCMRRFDLEGRPRMYFKSFLGTIYYIFDVKKMPFEYEWAHYKKAEPEEEEE